MAHDPQLRDFVQDHLEQRWSTQQICHALPIAFPGQPQRHLVHETIYQALFVQGRGELRRELARALRTGRARRKPHRRGDGHPRKGTIAPGSDADLILIDPQVSRIATPEKLHMATDYTPYQGRELWGWPHTVIQRGRVVIENGQMYPDQCSGRSVAADRIRT